ncbi:DUF748 domain-containing protein [Pseudogulbenkiania ferrooxidans]|uniref:DUF748 domain-containing protein n=1 Tax=Pseudogulbenkiania ferrooxidans TaxID=549169 RepID=UPI00030DAF04|nr:DUF748 domain-containing protein [Pseudogulbenkiania ferrooxidans]
MSEREQDKGVMRRRRWPYWVGGGALALVAASWGALAWGVPDVARHAAADWAQGKGQKLSIGTMKIEPWSMKVELGDVRLAEGNGAPLFAARRLVLDAEPTALFIGRWRAALFQLDKPQWFVERNAQGEWNWARFVKAVSGPAKPATESKGELPKLVLDLLQLNGGEVRMVDHFGGETRAFDLKPVNLTLKELSTLPVDGGSYTLTAELGDGAKLAWKGNVGLQPLQSSGEARLDKLTLASLWPYVQPFFHTAPPQGELAASARYQFDLSGKTPQLKVAPFNATLNRLHLAAPGGGSALALKQLALEGGRFDLASSSVDITRLRLSDGELSAQRNGAGQLDWLAALPPAKAETAPAKPSPWQVKVGEIRAENWRYRFGDAGFVQPLEVQAAMPLLSTQLAVEPKDGVVLSKLGTQLADIGVGAAGSTPVIRLATAALADSELRLARHEVRLGALTLGGLEADVERNRQGEINLQQVFAKSSANPAVKPAAATGDAPGWQLHYPTVTLENGRLNWLDQTLPRPLRATLSELSVNAAPQDSGALALDVDSRLESGRLAAKLTLAPDGAALGGKITASAVPLAPFAPYALSGTVLKLAGGTLSANLDVDAGSKGWKVGGQGALNRFSLLEPNNRQPLLAWRQLALNGLSASSGTPLKVQLREVRLSDPVARLILNQQRQLNVSNLLAGKPAAAAPAPAPTATPAAPPAPVKVEVKAKKPAAPGASQVEVRTVHVQGGDIEFADLGMKPSFATRIHNLRGSIQGLSSQPGRRGTVTLDGDVDQYGDVRVRGALAPQAVTDDADITLAFRNIPLTSLNPYSMNFAGWKVNDGRLSVDLRYLLDKRQLKAENRVVIDSIQLGEEVQEPGVTRLPLRLAVALLEDSDGRIDLDLPISGSLDDPQFSYGRVVWKAFVNVITKIVTAPFRALGALMGGEGFDEVRFVAGEANVAPPEREKLDKLAAVLVKRPRMTLVLAGTYDPAVETRELARARIDRAILQAAGHKLEAGEPLPLPDLDDPAVQSAVKSVFAQRIGRLKLVQRLLSLPDNVARYKTLREQLIAAEPVSETELKALAQARVTAARQAMLKTDPTLAERLTLGEAKRVKADGDGVALAIALGSR